MIRLLYLSTLNPEATETEVEMLLIDAAARNHDLHVTGILAIEGRRVCQILEGDKEIVSHLFEVIRRDPRHGGVVEMDRRTIKERGFPEWAMVRRPMVDVVVAALTD